MQKRQLVWLVALTLLLALPISTLALTVPVNPVPVNPIQTGIIIDDPFNNEIEAQIAINGGLNTGHVFGGYGVLTDDTLLVVTSHPGVKDSETQLGPGTFYICKPSDPNDWCGDVWHAHLVNLQQDTTDTCAPNTNLNGVRLEVASLSFEEPTTNTINSDPVIELDGVSTLAETFTNSVTGSNMIFQLGNMPDPKQLVEFNLAGKVDSNNNLHVCVEDVSTKQAGFFVLPESAIGAIAVIGASIAVFGGYILHKRRSL